MSVVTTYYLEMQSADQLKEKTDANGLEICEAEIKQYQVNRFLYQLVGGHWAWDDKLSLTDEQWAFFAESKNLRTWIAYFKGSIAGYYELEKQRGGDVEIAYFGLAPLFIGKGFGSYLLSHAIKSAWAWEGTKRVHVQTCTLDHPTALKNYLASGFELYREEQEPK